MTLTPDNRFAAKLKASASFMKLPLSFLVSVTQLSPLATNDAISAQETGQAVLEFEHTYRDVFAPTADDYINETINIGKGTDIGVSYWSPLRNRELAFLTQRVDFPSETLSASLRCGLASFNFGNGNFGFGALWISKDATTWLKILDAPTLAPPSRKSVRKLIKAEPGARRNNALL